MRELGFTDEQLIEIIRKHEDYGLLHVLQPQVHLENLADRSSS